MSSLILDLTTMTLSLSTRMATRMRDQSSLAPDPQLLMMDIVKKRLRVIKTIPVTVQSMKMWR